MYNKPKGLRGVVGWLGSPLTAVNKWFHDSSTKPQPRVRIEFCGKAKNSKTAAQAKREAKKRKNKQ